MNKIFRSTLGLAACYGSAGRHVHPNARGYRHVRRCPDKRALHRRVG